RADVYALGAILYELATLQAPYTGSPVQILTAVLRDAPPKPREVAPDLPRPLAAIVERAMARERTQRYADAAALAQEITAFLDGLAGTAVKLEALAQARERALADVDADRVAIERQTRRSELEVEDVPEVQRALAPLVARAAAARRSIDRSFARASVGRAPAAF